MASILKVDEIQNAAGTATASVQNIITASNGDDRAYAQLNKAAGMTIAANTYTTIPLDQNTISKNISISNGNILFALPGVYQIIFGFRFGTGGDVWTGSRLFGDGGTVASSYGTGQTTNDPGPVTFNMMASIVNTSAEYSLQVYRLASTLAVATPVADAGTAFVCTIFKVS